MTLEEELLREPCNGEVTYREIVREQGTRSLLQECSCGAFLGSHLLQDESEIIWPHCQSLITREHAIEGLGELLMCHRKGLTYNAYMGLRADGRTELTPEEYTTIVQRRLTA